MKVRFPKPEEMTGGPREIPKAGWYDACCVDVIDDGIVKTKFGKKPAMTLVFQLEESGANGRRFLIFHRLWLSQTKEGESVLTEGAISQLGGWLGVRAVEEMQDAEEELIGKSASLKIIHKSDGTNTYANIAAIDSCRKPGGVEPGEYSRPGPRQPKEDDDD